MGAFIAKMLLPTVSSLVFLPTASVAAKRGFHMEAMVYFFTMFFTAVRVRSCSVVMCEILVKLLMLVFCFLFSDQHGIL